MQLHETHTSVPSSTMPARHALPGRTVPPRRVRSATESAAFMSPCTPPRSARAVALRAARAFKAWWSSS